MAFCSLCELFVSVVTDFTFLLEAQVEPFSVQEKEGTQS